MPIHNLIARELRLTIDPDTLGFSDTSELLDCTVPWIGQERAESAAHFGLGMEQADYNLFVLGEVGSGRSSLLKQAMEKVASQRPVPPDLCYLYNFDAPERPRALRLPAGHGRQFRQAMARMLKALVTEIPRQLDGPDYKVESERIFKDSKEREARAFVELEAFGEARRFTMHRESGRIMFTLRDEQGHVLTDEEMLALPKEQRVAITQAEQELLAVINQYFEDTRAMERVADEALAALGRQVVKPLVDRALDEVRSALLQPEEDHEKLDAYLSQVMADILDNLEVFKPSESDEEVRKEELARVLSRYRVNLVVDNDGLQGAPVIVENNPLYRALFGSIEYQSENEVLVTDFSRIRVGSLHKAHGGFLMLHLRDLLADGLVWEKLRRFLRSGLLQIEEPGVAFAPIAAVSLEPEAVEVVVKLVLIGSRDLYYDLQEDDPEFARRFRVKVDFAEQFATSDDTRMASACFVAQVCQQRRLPHFSASAVARLLEQGHRQAEDRSRHTAIFGQIEALVIESAALCRARSGELVEAHDVEAALVARDQRHNYPEQCLREAIDDGDVLISVEGSQIGQVNGLTVVDLGDHCFGYPVRVTARTYAGEDGLISIEREVAMSGPIHDKGMLILRNYLSGLFSRNTPLALSASVVFEQEYRGVEGDSASCAELYALLSSLSGLPIRQGIAVTGALNQHGEVLPVGGINEKIEGYFKVCAAAGLDGSQGVLIPHRNRRHLVLGRQVVDAVAQGRFHVHTVEQVIDGLELLTGVPTGKADKSGVYPPGSVLGLAQMNLQAYRRSCQSMEPRMAHRPRLR